MLYQIKNPLRYTNNQRGFRFLSLTYQNTYFCTFLLCFILILSINQVFILLVDAIQSNFLPLLENFVIPLNLY